MAEVSASLAVWALLDLWRVVISDKLTSLGSQIEPVVQKYRATNSLVRQCMLSDHFEGVPGNITVNISANYYTESIDIV